MTWVAAAVIGAGALGAGAGIYGASQQAGAAEEAAQSNIDAAKIGQNTQLRMWNEGRADMAPWRDTGEQALYSIADLMGIQAKDKAGNLIPRSDRFGYMTRDFGLSDFQADPGYAFRLAEGEKAINRAAAARGNYFSGATGKALVDYGQNMGANEYANVYNRFMGNRDALYNRYAGLSGTGMTTATNIAQGGMNTGQNVANTMMQGANAAGQNYQNAAAARSSGYNNAANAVNAGVNNYMFYDLMKQPAGFGASSSMYGGSGSNYINNMGLR